MTQLELALIPHSEANTVIYQRAVDGYVNATAMCKAVNKNFADYARNANAQAFLAELSSVMGIPITELIQTLRGGNPAYQGTWVHPDVAINLGQWCSPKFAVAVSKWVREWLTGKSKPTNLPYHVQRYIANRSEIPTTHFSMLHEMVFALIAPLESAGYVLPENMVPDISEGKMFCKWLRDEKDIDTDQLPTYNHVYPDGRIVKAKLYPNELLADFRKHFHEVWLPKKAVEYFELRDKQALNHLSKLLPKPVAK